MEVPGITVTGVTGFGTSSYPRGWLQTNWDFKNIFTWVRSSHTWKTGGELRRMYGSAINTTNYVPAYTFFSILNFANDEARQMTRYVDPRTGEPVTAYSELRQTEWAVFLNDDWKVNRNLTINAGVRYENYGTFVDKDGTLRNLIYGPGATFAEQLASARVDFVDKFYPSDNNNFAPRLGFAWDPTGDAQMAVRGGYGLAYDRLMNLPAENYRHSPPLRASVTLGQVFGTAFTYSLGDPSKPYLGYPVDPALRVGLDSRNGVIGAKVGITAVDPNLKMPYAHNWFVGIQRNLVSGIVMDANYLGSAGRSLHNAYNINRYVGDLVDGRFDGYNPSFSTINMVTSTSRSLYHGGSIQVKRLFQQGFMAQGSYTFGKAMDDSDAAVGTIASGMRRTSMPDYSVAGYDVTHKVSLMGLWGAAVLQEQPPPPGSGAASWGAGRSRGYAILQTGTPLNVTNGAAYPNGDYNADGPAATGSRCNERPSVRQSGWSRTSNPGGFLQVSDFPKPAAGQNGTLGRNAFRGPGFADVSLSLSKKFVVTPRSSAEFRLDAFNAFNRVNLGDPTMDLNSNDFGKSTSQLAPRALQVGVRIRY